MFEALYFDLRPSALDTFKIFFYFPGFFYTKLMFLTFGPRAGFKGHTNIPFRPLHSPRISE